MISSKKDIAIESLLHSVREVAPEIPDGLIEKIYQIEKHNQFNADEEVRFKAVKALIDSYISAQIG
jgi:hypothetical protein